MSKIIKRTSIFTELSSVTFSIMIPLLLFFFFFLNEVDSR